MGCASTTVGTTCGSQTIEVVVVVVEDVVNEDDELGDSVVVGFDGEVGFLGLVVGFDGVVGLVGLVVGFIGEVGFLGVVVAFEGVVGFPVVVFGLEVGFGGEVGFLGVDMGLDGEVGFLGVVFGVVIGFDGVARLLRVEVGFEGVTELKDVLEEVCDELDSDASGDVAGVNVVDGSAMLVGWAVGVLEVNKLMLLDEVVWPELWLAARDILEA